MTGTIFFKSEGHKERLVTTIQQIGKVWPENGRLDPEYASALLILTADSGVWHQASGYVGRDGIDFETMLAEVDFSGGYGVMVEFAWNLFNDRRKVDVLELLRLDESNFQVALSALILRREGAHISEALAWPA